MKKYKALITSTLIIAMMVTIPALSFAQDNNKDGNMNKAKVEQSRDSKSDKDNQKNNSWFNFSNWFNNKNGKDTTAPVISNVIATSTKAQKAAISWTTDIKANSFVWYSKTAGIDTTINPTMKRNDRVLNHKIDLKKLEANTKYYVVVGSANKIGMIKSAEISFTTPVTIIDTPRVDTVAPVISEKQIKINASTVTISWKTNEPSTSKIFYSVSTTPLDINATATTSVSDEKLVKNHSLSLPLLTLNSIYHFIIKSIDAQNNGTVSSESSFIAQSL